MLGSRTSTQSLKTSILEKVPATGFAAVAQCTSKLLKKDTIIDWSQIPATGHFNPIAFVSARINKSYAL